MNKVLASACIIALMLLSACVGQAEYDTSLPVYPVTSPSSPVYSDTLKNTIKDTANAAVTTISQQVLPSIALQSNAAKSTVALNPKHGIAGHRCDIAVGAPLNSPLQQAEQIAPATQILPARPKPFTNSSGTVKLNPAHGQPGHDCAIQVGQPLKG